MVIRSPYPDLNIPEQDVLTYIFGSGDDLPESPLWINAANPDSYLSLRQGLQWIKRLAIGLDRLGVEKGDILMMVSPNHIFVPIAYLGAVGSGRIFSGANPLYTVDGREALHLSLRGDNVQVSRPDSLQYRVFFLWKPSTRLNRTKSYIISFSITVI